MTAKEWIIKYEKELNNYKQWFPSGSDKPQEGYQEAPLAYDAIWAIAFALNGTIDKLSKQGITLDEFKYEKTPKFAEILKKELQNVSFPGVSGQVAFTELGDRISWTLIEQMIEGEYKHLGYYDIRSDNLTWLNKERWFVSGRPPKDRTEIVRSLQTVNNVLFISLSVISLIGILMAISLICFNQKFSNYR